MALQIGERVPAFTAVGAPGETIDSSTFFAAGPVAIHFYVFDFSGSPEGG